MLIPTTVVVPAMTISAKREQPAVRGYVLSITKYVTMGWEFYASTSDSLSPLFSDLVKAVEARGGRMVEVYEKANKVSTATFELDFSTLEEALAFRQRLIDVAAKAPPQSVIQSSREVSSGQGLS
jgi:hypothetical protein